MLQVYSVLCNCAMEVNTKKLKDDAIKIFFSVSNAFLNGGKMETYLHLCSNNSFDIDHKNRGLFNVFLLFWNE